MKKLNAIEGLSYLTTTQVQSRLPKGFDISGLQKYKIKGSRKTYYLEDDIKRFPEYNDGSFVMNEPKQTIEKSEAASFALDLVAYVDGSFNKNTGVYGSAAILIANDTIIATKTSRGTKMNSMWNIAGEISAAALAVKLAEEYMPDSLLIKYDCEGVAKWPLGEYRAKNEYTQKYVEFMNKPRSFPIYYEHVKAHTGDKYNEMADDMALGAAGLKTMEHSVENFEGMSNLLNDEIRLIKYQVKASCTKGIKAFYGKDKHAFKDFASLKTYGSDNFSSMTNIKDFESVLTKDELLYIKARLTEAPDLLTAMRWTARGLRADDAVRKTLVDKKIYARNNFS